MTVAARQIDWETWSQSRFLAWAEAQPEGCRYEFDGFRPVAMAPATVGHTRIGRNIREVIRPRLPAGTPCDLGLAAHYDGDVRERSRPKPAQLAAVPVILRADLHRLRTEATLRNVRVVGQIFADTPKWTIHSQRPPIASDGGRLFDYRVDWH